MKNSTFDTTSHNFVQLKAAIAGGIVIDNCTFYNNVAASKYFIDSNNLATNITISNTILGKSMAESSRGIRTTGSITIIESLRTSDCVYGSNDIKDFAKDSRSSADIFTDPDNHTFTLKIDKKIGDPRWYMQE